jgi:hypothetical protein
VDLHARVVRNQRQPLDSASRDQQTIERNAMEQGETAHRDGIREEHRKDLGLNGLLAQAQELLIDSYQVSEVLDRRICPVCETLHGKEFQVVRERARLQQLLQLQDPDALKTAAPWPRQDPDSVKRLRTLSEAEIQANGWGSPPYHPLCRGQLVPTGTVREVLEVVDEAAAAPVGGRAADQGCGGQSEPPVTEGSDSWWSRSNGRCLKHAWLRTRWAEFGIRSSFGLAKLVPVHKALFWQANQVRWVRRASDREVAAQWRWCAAG